MGSRKASRCLRCLPSCRHAGWLVVGPRGVARMRRPGCRCSPPVPERGDSSTADAPAREGRVGTSAGWSRRLRGGRRAARREFAAPCARARWPPPGARVAARGGPRQAPSLFSPPAVDGGVCGEAGKPLEGKGLGSQAQEDEEAAPLWMTPPLILARTGNLSSHASYTSCYSKLDRIWREPSVSLSNDGCNDLVQLVFRKHVSGYSASRLCLIQTLTTMKRAGLSRPQTCQASTSRSAGRTHSIPHSSQSRAPHSEEHFQNEVIFRRHLRQMILL